jgi:hypothetical protein
MIYWRFLTAIVVAAGLCMTVTSSHAQALPKDKAKCESGAGKSLSKFTKSKSSCISKCITTARKASGPFGGCFAPYTDSTTNMCIKGSLKGAEAKSGAAIAKVCAAAASCPLCYVSEFTSTACTDASGLNPFVQFAEGLLDLFGPNLYCVESGGGTPSKTDAKCEDGLTKNLVKYAQSKAKCYDKCQTAANKAGKSFAQHGCFPPASDSTTDSCISTAMSKIAPKIDQACFTAPATFPSCYDGSLTRPNTTAGWLTLTENAVDATTKRTNCGSPSGAFVE